MSEQHIPFARGFPTDWPIRPGNVLQLDWRAMTRNKIDLWIPEAVRSRSHGTLLMILHEEACYRFERIGNDSWRHTFEKPGVLRLEGITRPIVNGIEMSLTIANCSADAWQAVSAGVCVQFHAAPDFRDPERQRTFYIGGGTLRTLAQSRVSTSGDGVCLFYGAGSSPECPPADVSFIGIHSADGHYVAATWWEGAQGVGGNCHPATMCIHSNPGFGDIPAGAEVTRRGRLYLMPGTPEDAWQRYREDTLAGSR